MARIMARISTATGRGELLTIVLVLVLIMNLAAFAVDFPALTGRIVDQANIIPAETRATIEPKLVILEAKTGIQLVVATVTSLEGNSIEHYATELFNTWRLGQVGKNNGVLLLVAPNEREVRMEVGPGLGNTLTNARAQDIIDNSIIPHFKTGDFSGGISRGVDDIISALTTGSWINDLWEWVRSAFWLTIAGLGIGIRLGRSSSGGGFSGGGGFSIGGGASGHW